MPTSSIAVVRRIPRLVLSSILVGDDCFVIVGDMATWITGEEISVPDKHCSRLIITNKTSSYIAQLKQKMINALYTQTIANIIH